MTSYKDLIVHTDYRPIDTTFKHLSYVKHTLYFYEKGFTYNHIIHQTLRNSAIARGDLTTIAVHYVINRAMDMYIVLQHRLESGKASPFNAYRFIDFPDRPPIVHWVNFEDIYAPP